MKLVDVIYALLGHLKDSAGRQGILAIVLFVIFLGTYNPLTMFFQTDHELLYEEYWDAYDCVNPKFCFMHYSLVVGNTGRMDYDQFELHFINLPPSMRLWGSRILGVQASAQPIRYADIEPIPGLGYPAYTIDNLQSGTLLKLELMHRTMPRTLAESLRDKEPWVRVYATGNVLEGDPRATAFGRLLGLFL